MWATLNTGNYYTEKLGNIKGSMFKSQPSWSLLLQDECQEGSHREEREYRTRGSSVNDIAFHLGFERWIECGHGDWGVNTSSRRNSMA